MIFIDCGDCDGTGRIACWSPGGPCVSGPPCETCGRCQACGGAGRVADDPAAGVRIEDGPRTGDGIDYAVDRARDRAVGL
ncbi:hypothetical protein [Nocardia wallacei]|uniref:hypothetical protein n=1 Tax=Nocardia wallacei TaxID=480035 RepID=UPI0024579F11|nr:hypothetical protein [Nocardia wallacei]